MAAKRVDTYTRAEYLSDAAVHVCGIVAALIAAPILIVLAALWHGETGVVTATVIYALSLLAMLACSACYNMIRHPPWKDTLRRVDQSAIYVKIAGTYTPFAVLAGSHAGLFLAGIWSTALAGASLILFARGPVRWLSLLLYLGLGWAGVVWGGPLVSQLSPAGFVLLLVGGCLYSAGVVFLLWERLPFHNTIWHVFVLAATALCYAAVVVEVGQRAILV